MPEKPYKEVCIADPVTDAVAVFTREKRDDAVIRMELQNGLSVRLDPHCLRTIAEVMEDDRLKTN